MDVERNPGNFRQMNGSALMIHGMCCTGAVWDNYRRFFEARGMRVFTPTLAADVRTRRSPPDAMRRLGLRDYVDEMVAAARAIADETGRKPAVIGHSMGGLIAQALAERGVSRATLLMSPAPPADCHVPVVRRSWLGYSVAHRTGLVPRGIYPHPAFVRRFVLNEVASAARRGEQRGMVQESARVFSDMRSFHVDHRRIDTPMHVVACGRDRMVPANLVKAVARKYRPIGATLAVYPQHGHWMYAEPHWERAADELHAWVARHA